MLIDTGILASQLLLFLTLFVMGFLAVFCKLITRSVHDGIATLITHVAIPALLCHTFATSDLSETRMLGAMVPGTLLALAVLALVGLVASKVLRLRGDVRNTHIFLSTFGMSGMFGIPLASALLGNRGLVAVAMYLLVDNWFCWSCGNWLKASHTGIKEKLPFGKRCKRLLKSILSPAICGMLIGLILHPLRISADSFFMKALDSVGSCCSPLALLFIGGNIARTSFTKLKANYKSATLCLTKQLLAPIVLYFLLRALHIEEFATVCLVLIACLPASANGAILCKANGSSATEYASTATVITSCFSIVGIPLLFWILRAIG